MVVDQILLNLGIITKRGNRILGVILGVLGGYFLWLYIDHSTVNFLITLMVFIGLMVIFLLTIPSKISKSLLALQSERMKPGEVQAPTFPRNQNY